MFDNLTINIPPEITINLNVKLDVTVRHVKPLKRPGPITINAIGEDMADNIRMTVTSTADEDVVSREVTVSVPGLDPVVLNYPVPGDPASFVVAQGLEFDVSIVDTDDGGNHSPATTGHFTANDTFPPAAPGAIELTATGEE